MAKVSNAQSQRDFAVVGQTATCEANSVNPYEYLRDVLVRVSTHPADRIDELLPDQWKPTAEA